MSEGDPYEMKKCNDHPDAYANLTCYNEECKTLKFCEKCYQIHRAVHDGSSEVRRRFLLISKIIQKNYASIARTYEDCIKKCKEIKIAEDEIKRYELKFEEIKELEKRFEKFAERIEQMNVQEFKEGELVGTAEEMKKEIIQIELQIKKFKDSLTEIRFHFCLVTRDFNSIMGYMDLDLGVLHLLDLDLKFIADVIIPKTEVLCCKGGGLFGGPSLVLIDDAAYFIGGFDTPNVSDKVFKKMFFNKDSPLIPLANIKEARFDACTVSIQRKYIFLISGATYPETQYTHIRSCEKYDIEKNKWVNVNPVNIGRSVAACCTFNERFIYVYAGEIGYAINSDTIEFYDILDDEKGWTIFNSAEKELQKIQCGTAYQISDCEILFLSEESQFSIEDLISTKQVRITEPQFSGAFYYRHCMMRNHKLYVKKYDYSNLAELQVLDCFTKQIQNINIK